MQKDFIEAVKMRNILLFRANVKGRQGKAADLGIAIIDISSVRQ
jgi:hypothetical protein